MDKIAITITLTILSTIFNCAFAKSSITPANNCHCASAMEAVYNFDSNTFDNEIHQIANETIVSYLREYNNLMHYVANNNEANYKTFLASNSKAISAIDKCDLPERFAIKSNLLLHKGLVEVSKGDALTGAMAIFKSYRAFKEGEKKSPTYIGQLKLRGVYNIVFSQIPDDMKSLTGFFGIEHGNLKQGLQQITEYISLVDNVRGLQQESLLLSFAHFFFSEQNTVNEQLAQKMRQSKSPVVIYTYILNLGKKNKGAEADQIFESLPHATFKSFPLLAHQQCKFALRRLDVTSALEAAKTFDNYYRGISCRADMMLLKSWAYKILNNDELGQKAANECIKTPHISNTDEVAINEAKLYKTIDINLLKARLLFEYGLYDKALAAISDCHVQNNNKIEYHYRLARILHNKKNSAKAIEEYNKAILFATSDKRYFGPYAAIYAAQLLLEEHNTNKAKEYISKAKTLNNGEYSKDINRRIEAIETKINKAN